MSERSCSVPGCEKAPYGRLKMCGRHDYCRRVYGDPTASGVRRAHGEVPRALEAAAVAETDECVILTGYKARPNVQLNGTWMNAARAVWIIAEGDPGDRYVLHSCNEGSGSHGCINRRHLYLGDHDQNMRDRNEAGHIPIGRTDQVGEDNGNATLTEESVREIRSRYVRGARREHPGSAWALAAEFRVTRSAIYGALPGGRKWNHVVD